MVGPGAITNLDDSSDKTGDNRNQSQMPKIGAHEDPRGDVAPTSMYGRKGGNRQIDLRLGRHCRGLLALRDLAARRRKRGIAALEAVPVRLTCENGGQDGSKDNQEGQGDDCESVHSGKDMGERGDTLGKPTGAAWRSLFEGPWAPRIWTI